MFDNYRSLEIWEKLGRQPKQREMKIYGKYTYTPYVSKFGSWLKAIYSFIEDRNKQDDNESVTEVSKEIEEVVVSSNTKDISNYKDKIIMKTPRMPSTRLRFRVLKRDNFTCRACGRSPHKDHSVILHIDHIKPYSKGGETVYDNLQTLCSKCNLGKSNL